MKNTIKVATLLSLSAATLLASGYRIPEQSLNSTALSAAYVASANGADASYYNPANMALMGGGAEIETAFTYINLPKVQYTDAAVSSRNADSKEEHFFVPTMHYVSPMMGDWRYGLSITAPGGLSKRWDESFQMIKAEEFTLRVIEVNPTASYKVNEQFAVGFGLRGVYSDGVIKLNDTLNLSGTGALHDHEMEADSIDFGYNLAMTFKPMSNLSLAATYRSKIDLTVSGEITGTSALTGLGAVYPSKVKTQVPLPASLVLATAYIMDKTTVEFVFERTYWSAYDKLDFDFTNPVLEASPFGAVTPKNWKDVNAYRIGVTHQYSDALKLMAAFAIDKNPIPDNRVAFELPDSDAKLYSVGFEYKLDKQMSIGMAYLYDDKESRKVVNASAGVNGTFTDSAAHLVTASLKYKF